LESNEDLQTHPQAAQEVAVPRTALAGTSFEHHAMSILHILMYFNLQMKEAIIM
jgi:hypothetical protein